MNFIVIFKLKLNESKIYLMNKRSVREIVHIGIVLIDYMII